MLMVNFYKFIHPSIPVAFWQFEIILTTVQWVLCLILIIHDSTQKRKGIGTVSNIRYSNMYHLQNHRKTNFQTDACEKELAKKLSVHYSPEARC